jgi:acetylglutamate kinase
MDKLYIIKIGGNIVDDEEKLSSFLKDFAGIKEAKILVHGGGKLATRLAEQMNVPQQMIDGRRVTDEGTLRIVTMVYAGYINKNIVSRLQAHKCDALGISGADGNAILAHKRAHPTIDYGYAGDIDQVNISLFLSFIEKKISLVVAPITHDGKGQLLNTNADTIAQEIAKALSKDFAVHLIYSFEKAGVLLDTDNENSVIGEMNAVSYAQLKSEKLVFAGMIPKLDNAFAALASGVRKVIIGKAEDIYQLISGEKGTSIIQ